MACWQGIQSHTVAGPRRPLTDFPVQPNGFLSAGLSPTASNEAAFDPRKDVEPTLRQNEVNLPRVAGGEPRGVPAPRKRKAEEILPTNICEVVHSKAETQAAFEQSHPGSGRELGARDQNH